MKPVVVAGIDYDSHGVHIAVLTVIEDVSVYTVRYKLESNLWTSLHHLRDVLAATRAEFIAIEAPVYIQNPRTSFGLVRVQTLVRIACESLGRSFVVLENTKWKKLAFGQAKLNKQQVFEKMKARFGMAITDHHFADATGLALAGKKILEEGE